MKSISITGYKRANVGKSATKQLRDQGFVPCELYGKDGNVHFTIFSTDFKELIYTPETFKIDLTIDGDKYQAITQDVQFHPLSDEILHADFLQVAEDQPVTIKLPLRFTGNSVGVKAGGKFVKKLRNLKVKGMLQDMPDAIEVDITDVDLGKSIKVRDITVQNLEIINAAPIPVATVEVPRGLKGKTTEEAAATGKKKK